MLRADDVQPADLFRVLWRQRYAAVAVAMVGAALAYGWALFIPDRYTAGTLVLVEDSELPRYVTTGSMVDLRARLNTISEQVLSRTRLEQIIDEHGLFATPGDSTPRESRIASVRRRITVSPIDTEGFRISFTHEDPKTAARVANALAQLFISSSTQAVERQVERTSSEIGGQLESVRVRLDAKDEEIRLFRAANRGALPEQLGSNHETVQAAQLRIRQIDTELGTARAEIARLEILAGQQRGGALTSARDQAAQIVATSPATELDARIEAQAPAVRLEARRMQREALLQQFTARHPDVRRVEAEIRRLEAMPGIDAVTVGAAGGDPATAAALTIARQQVGRLQAERSELRSRISEVQGYIDRSPDVQSKLADLEREQDALLTSYQDLQGRTLEAEIVGNLQVEDGVTSFRVLDPAVVPEMPGSPQRVLFFLGGAFVGMGLVFGGAVLREMLLEPIDNASEVERFAGIPVLASIPEVDTPQRRRSLRLRWLASATAVGSVLTVVFILRLMMRP